MEFDYVLRDITWICLLLYVVFIVVFFLDLLVVVWLIANSVVYSGVVVLDY